jgi:hypothetical protein
MQALYIKINMPSGYGMYYSKRTLCYKSYGNIHFRSELAASHYSTYKGQIPQTSTTT